MRKLKIALLFLASAGFVMPVRAELKGKNEVAVQAGAMMFEGDADLNTSFIAGARLGHFFTERLSGEVAAFSVRTGANLTTLSPSLAASYHFRFGKFMPFIQAGAGMLRLQPKGETASNNLAAHWGGGLKYLYTPHLMLRADVDHVIDTESGRGTNNLATALGVSFLFGASDKDERKAVLPATPPVLAAAAPTPVVIREIEFEDRHFDFDSSTIRPLGKEVLKENAQYLKENPKVTVLVEGYTSIRGTAEYNQKLSERRAKAVADYLVAEGVDPSRISTIGYGEMRPAVSEASASKSAENTTAAKANRRVVMKLLQQ